MTDSNNPLNDTVEAAGRSMRDGDIEVLISPSSAKYKNLDASAVPSMARTLEFRREKHRLVMDLRLLKKYLVGPTVLDFPIGTGRLLSYTSKLYDLYGYDISEAYVDAAKERFPEISRHFEVHAMERITNPRVYDSVYSLRVTSHIADFPRAIASVASIVRPGGRWIFSIAPQHKDYADLNSLLDVHGFQLVADFKYDAHSGQVQLRGIASKLYARWKMIVERFPMPFWMYKGVDTLFLPFAHARMIVAEKTGDPARAT